MDSERTEAINNPSTVTFFIFRPISKIFTVINSKQNVKFKNHGARGHILTSYKGFMDLKTITLSQLKKKVNERVVSLCTMENND